MISTGDDDDREVTRQRSLPRFSYNLSLTFEIIHKIDQTAQTLGMQRHDLVEKLLRLGLQHFLDLKKNPANRPVRSAKDVLAKTAKTTDDLTVRVDNLERRLNAGFGPGPGDDSGPRPAV